MIVIPLRDELGRARFLFWCGVVAFGCREELCSLDGMYNAERTVVWR